jgi:hypothetical protein
MARRAVANRFAALRKATSEEGCPMQENRKHPRKQVDRSWEVIDLNREEPLGRLVNISRSGLMLLSGHPIEVGRVFQLRLTLADDEESVFLGVESLWVETLWAEPSNEPDRFWAGMQIIDMSSKDSQAIDAMLHASD